MVAAGGGGLPALGGNPASAIIGLVLLLIVIGIVVWKMA